jgi:DNA invertase Pin-like site-specific DNA recombinase
MPGTARESGRYTPPKAKTRWILYFRLSIGDPNLERDAARQRAELHGLVKRRGGVVVAELGINDRSASEFAKQKRTDYATAMAMIDRGEADAIAFSRVDRILRRMDECVDLLRRVRESNLEVWDVSADDDEDGGGGEMRLNTALGRKRLQAQVNDAEHEAAVISWRVKRSTAARRAAGRSLGPIGFGWKDRTTKNPKEAKVAEQMLQRVLRGESLVSVARWLNAKGVGRVRSELPWDATSVNKVVTTPKNFGLAVWDGEITPLNEPGLFPAELYHQAVDTIASRSRSNRPRRAEVLAGLASCAGCGMPMLRSVSASSGRVILQCRKQHNTGRCGAGNIDYAIVEKWLTEMVCEWVDGAELADLVAPAARVDTDAIKAEQAELEQMMKEAHAEWMEAAVRYGRNDSRAKAARRAYDLTDTRANARLDELHAQLVQRSQATVLNAYVGQTGALAKRWARLATEVRRQIITEALDLKHLRIEVAVPAPGTPGGLGYNLRFDASDPATVNAAIDRLQVVERTG